jgi:secreted trypsin-like serine protease
MLRPNALSLIAVVAAGAAASVQAQTNLGTTRGLDRSPPFDDLRIVGGEVVSSAKDWPWQVAVYFTSEGKLGFHCGGSLIADRWVLTAAHCVFNNNRVGRPEEFAIVEGTTQIDRVLEQNPTHGGQKLAIRRIIPHENYVADKSENDIALMELATRAQSTPVPYSAPQRAAAEAPGARAVVTGWGLLRGMKIVGGRPVDAHTEQVIPNENLSQYMDDKLRRVEVPVLATQSCRDAWASHSSKTIDARTICAGLATGGKDSCNGDSGGPLVVRDEKNFYFQAGIVSWGPTDCGVPGLTGVYTRVSAFDAWLREKTAIRQDEPSPEIPSVINELGAIGNAAGLDVSLVRGQRLKIDETVQYRATARQAGYLLLLDVSPDGAITQIYPNSASLRSETGNLVNANRLDPRRPLVVPSRSNPYEGFEFKVEGPPGEGRLVAILSKEPMKGLKVPEAPRSFDSRTDALGYVAGLRLALDRGLDVEAKADPAISVVIKPYTIVR